VDLCDVLVSGDTLALHIGIALKKRLVAYFGPTSDTEIDVYDSGEKVMPIAPCECYYQGQRTAKVSCMQNLKEKDMLAAVERQLKEVR
jgi:heptosyltransferase-2